MDISIKIKIVLKNYQTERCLFFLMVKDPLNPNITFLDEKLWPVAWNPNFTTVYKEKKWKMPIKIVKLKSSKKVTSAN